MSDRDIIGPPEYDPWWDEMWRWHTKEEALRGHTRLAAALRGGWMPNTELPTDVTLECDPDPKTP